MAGVGCRLEAGTFPRIIHPQARALASPRTNARGNRRAVAASPIPHRAHSIWELEFCVQPVMSRPLNQAAFQRLMHDRRFRDGLEKSNIRVSGNIRIRTRVWLPEPLSRSANWMETLDDQIRIPWRGLISLSGDCNSGTRATSYPGAGRIRLSLSQR
jgi:hypothetical protein